MSYGVRIRNTAGETVFDSLTAQGGVVIDLFTSSPGGNTRNYPAFAGRVVFAGLACGYVNSSALVVDYAQGFPRLTVPAGWGNQVVLVFAK